jgi:porphobilinogen deaminase
VAALDDPPVRAAVAAERAVLKAMGGGCRSPLGALAEVADAGLTLVAGVPGAILRRSVPLNDQDRLVEEITQSLTKEETWQPR